MNIFALDENPHAIARHYPDIHLRKMLVEYVQLLSNAWPANLSVYKRTHYNHPCSKWARTSRMNYEWLYSLVQSMGYEYLNRFNKSHLSWVKVRQLPRFAPHLPSQGLTSWPQVMPIEFQGEDAIKAYRKYYASKIRGFRLRGICKKTCVNLRGQ